MDTFFWNMTKMVQVDGYCQYNGQKVHRLIAKAFCEGETEEKCFVNHKDGNKQNNHYANLEWVTPSRNLRHAHEKGLVNLKPRKTGLGCCNKT